MLQGEPAKFIIELNEVVPETDLISTRYTDELRAVGQTLEGQSFVSIEVQAEDHGYWVRATVKERDKPRESFGALFKKFLRILGISDQSGDRTTCRTIKRRCSAQQIRELIQNGIARRHIQNAAADPFSLSHILRTVGAYLDGLDRVTLIRIFIEDRWIAIRYRSRAGQVKESKEDLQFYYDYWVKMYLCRSDHSLTLSATDPTYTTR